MIKIKYTSYLQGVRWYKTCVWKRILMYIKNNKKYNYTTRLAPSPTGIFHIGSAYISVFALSYSKWLILWIDDTDVRRNWYWSIKLIELSLRYLKIINRIHFFTKQSLPDNMYIYNWFIDQLLRHKFIYKCNCIFDIKLWLKGCYQRCDQREKPIDENYCLWFNIKRIKDVVFIDPINHRWYEFDTKKIDNFLIQRNNGRPSIFLCAPVDDLLCNVDAVFWAEDWFKSAPKYIVVFRALIKILKIKHSMPNIIHLSLIWYHDKRKISKRSICSKSAVNFINIIKMGLCPWSCINFLLWLGYKNVDQVPLNQKNFKFIHVWWKPSIFDIKRLKHMNKMYVKKLTLYVFIKKYIRYIKFLICHYKILRLQIHKNLLFKILWFNQRLSYIKCKDILFIELKCKCKDFNLLTEHLIKIIRIFYLPLICIRWWWTRYKNMYNIQTRWSIDCFKLKFKQNDHLSIQYLHSLSSMIWTSIYHFLWYVFLDHRQGISIRSILCIFKWHIVRI